MSFRIVKEPAAWRAVEWAGFLEDGTEVVNRVELKLVRLGVEEFIEHFEVDTGGMTKAERVAHNRRVFNRVTRAWRGVEDEEGSPLPFEAPAMNALIDTAGFIAAFSFAYVLYWNGQAEERKGNSEPSLVGGQASGGTAPAEPASATA